MLWRDSEGGLVGLMAGRNWKVVFMRCLIPDMRDIFRTDMMLNALRVS
jgi:hypothetical protein